MMSPPFISVVIPAYNEEKRIQPSLKRVLRYLRENFPRFEIIAVDDGSTDDTADKIAAMAAEEAEIRVISFPTNHGKGFAVRQGVLRAQGGIVLFTDADLSTPVEAVAEALKVASKDYPVVIASRRHPDSIIQRRQSWLRERFGRCFNFFVRTLLALPFQDTQCGFKCFTREAAREIFTRARTDAFVFDVEALVIARRLGYAIKEIPVCWTDFPGSKVRFSRSFFPIMKELLAIYYHDFRGRYRPETARD